MLSVRAEKQYGTYTRNAWRKHHDDWRTETGRFTRNEPLAHPEVVNEVSTRSTPLPGSGGRSASSPVPTLSNANQVDILEREISFTIPEPPKKAFVDLSAKVSWSAWNQSRINISQIGDTTPNHWEALIRDTMKSGGCLAQHCPPMSTHEAKASGASSILFKPKMSPAEVIGIFELEQGRHDAGMNQTAFSDMLFDKVGGANSVIKLKLPVCNVHKANVATKIRGMDPRPTSIEN